MSGEIHGTLTQTLTSWGMSLVLLLSAVGSAIYIFALHRRDREELPRHARLGTVLDRISAVQWSADESRGSIDALSGSIVEMFRDEIAREHRARVGRRRLGDGLRRCGFVLITLGLICPLLMILSPGLGWIERSNYIIFVAAAAALASSECLSRPAEDQRALLRQYGLERLLNRFVLDWSEWRRATPGAEDWEQGFSILRKLSSDAFDVLQERR